MTLSPAHSPLRVVLVDGAELAQAGFAAMLTPFHDRVQVVAPHDAVQDPAAVDVLLFEPTTVTDVQQHMLNDLHGPGTVVAAYSWTSSVTTAMDHVGDGQAMPRVDKTRTASQVVRALEELRSGRYRSPAAPATESHAQTTEAPRSLVDARAERELDQVGLTDRERQVMSRIVAGDSNGEIADVLHLSINSVKTYIRAAYRKIGVERRTQAVLWGLDHGLGEQPVVAVPDTPEDAHDDVAAASHAV